MGNYATSKIHSAKKSWHNTVGEYLLRYGGIFLSITILAIGFFYAHQPALLAPSAGSGYVIKYDSESAGKTLYFVSVNSDAAYLREVAVLKEAIASYHGVNIIDLNRSEKVKNNAVVFVLGHADIEDVDELSKIIQMVADKNLPLYWAGSGISKVGHILGIHTADEEELSLTPPNSYLTYKGANLAADGLPFTRVNLNDLMGKGEVLANLELHETFTRTALIRNDNFIYAAFNPFSSAAAPFALSVINDSLSLLVGQHKTNPRVIFRLEDVNASSYGTHDSSFTKTTDYLIEQGVFVHLGIIPTMVDENGNVAAQIDAAVPVLNFIKQHPEQVAVVQHGHRHYRKDPRNKGMGSGDAFEFFIDDDQTMGVDVARNFAIKVLEDGFAVMRENGLETEMFEAPHYIMSPSQQQAAEEMFSLMQHEPLFYESSPYGFFLPWLTQRNTTVYAPSSSGYVDSLNPDSVNEILYSLAQAAKILPDPVVVVFFHPFMKEFKGREGDLEKLIQGIKKLNYRFVNMKDKVAPL